jgi:hypothetical protein
VTVQKLPNGNWEVKEGMVYEYLRLKVQVLVLEARLKELEK